MDAPRNNANDNRFGSVGRRTASVSPSSGLPAKEAWIQLYTGRILSAWFRLGSPLGLAWTYANWIQNSLSELYEQPLTKAFIEKTY